MDMKMQPRVLLKEVMQAEECSSSFVTRNREFPVHTTRLEYCYDVLLLVDGTLLYASAFRGNINEQEVVDFAVPYVYENNTLVFCSFCGYTYALVVWNLKMETSNVMTEDSIVKFAN